MMQPNPPSNPAKMLWLQKVATPLTIITFVITGFTGLLLFFEYRSLPVKVIHEWLSVLFVVAVALHAVRNWRAMISQLKRWPVWSSLVVIASSLTLLALLGPGRSQHQRQEHGQPSNEVGHVSPAPAP